MFTIRKKAIFSILISSFFFSSCEIFSDGDYFIEGERVQGVEFTVWNQFIFPATFSPDGNSIVFLDLEGLANFEKPTFKILDLKTGEKKSFYSGTGFEHSPVWSPDGDWILFRELGVTYKIKTDGTELKSLISDDDTTIVNSTNWSSDGKKILYYNSLFEKQAKHGLWIMNSDGSEKQFLFNESEQIPYPLKKKYVSFVNIGGFGGERKLHIYDIETGTFDDTLDIVEDPDVNYLEFSPDENRIVFHSESGIYVMDSDGNNLTRILKSEPKWEYYRPMWHPDSKRIIYQKNDIEVFSPAEDEGGVISYKVTVSYYILDVDEAVRNSNLSLK